MKIELLADHPDALPALGLVALDVDAATTLSPSVVGLLLESGWRAFGETGFLNGETGTIYVRDVAK